MYLVMFELLEFNVNCCALLLFSVLKWPIEVKRVSRVEFLAFSFITLTVIQITLIKA